MQFVLFILGLVVSMVKNIQGSKRDADRHFRALLFVALVWIAVVVLECYTAFNYHDDSWSNANFWNSVTHLVFAAIIAVRFFPIETLRTTDHGTDCGERQRAALWRGVRFHQEHRQFRNERSCIQAHGGLFLSRLTRILRRNAHGYNRRRPFHALKHLHRLSQQLGCGTFHPDGYHVGMTSIYSVGNMSVSALACSTASVNRFSSAASTRFKFELTISFLFKATNHVVCHFWDFFHFKSDGLRCVRPGNKKRRALETCLYIGLPQLHFRGTRVSDSKMARSQCDCSHRNKAVCPNHVEVAVLFKCCKQRVPENIVLNSTQNLPDGVLECS